MRIFFSVGEPSGDLHGANLINQLRARRPGLECVGFGGPRMAEAGCTLHEDLTKLAIMGIVRVLGAIHHFWKLYCRADQYLREQRPDAVVLIDYPGFNWWIARSAKRHGIPVFYYGVPQMWGWAPWRVKKMRRLVDHALCKLPFEAEWFRNHGCHATYVGHPYFDEVTQRKLDVTFVQKLRSAERLVTILPGSRTQEVLSNLPRFLRAATLVLKDLPRTRFAIASFNEKQATMARDMVSQLGLPIEIYVHRTAELIEAAYCCLACSGSVSLELLYHEKPTVIHYSISRTLHFFQPWLRQVPYITLVNLLATENLFSSKPNEMSSREKDSVPFPEFLTCEDKSREMADHITQWLCDETEHGRRVHQLRGLKRQFAHPGASATAAKYVLQSLEARPSHSIPPPQFEMRDAA